MYLNRALLILTLATPTAYADFYGKVISISDGDTITVLKEGKSQVKIRLLNIDAPEKNQAFGTQAKNFLGNLIFTKTVLIKDKSVDQYGRVLGTVFLNDLNINKEIVRNGYAWAYRRYLDDRSYIGLESEARVHKRGLWRDNSPIEPEKWRKLK